MNVVFLTRDLNEYKAAMYQREFRDALSTECNLVEYGPHVSWFRKDSLASVLERQELKFDLVFIGHSWLSDNESDPLDPFKFLRLSECSIPKVGFLNKEYSRLQEKISRFFEYGVSIIFTHHWSLSSLASLPEIKTVFVPFGFEANKLPRQAVGKKFDLAFSGVLRNQRGAEVQNDVRLKVLNEIFYTFLDVPLVKRKKYKHVNIYWNSIPRTKLGYALARVLRRYKRLDDHDYYELISTSRLFLNTLSPVELISPRIYENMACMTIPITCGMDDVLEVVHPEIEHVSFSRNMDEFYDTLMQVLARINLLDEAAKRNYMIALADHSWSSRVKTVLKACRQCC